MKTKKLLIDENQISNHSNVKKIYYANCKDQSVPNLFFLLTDTKKMEFREFGYDENQTG